MILRKLLLFTLIVFLSSCQMGLSNRNHEIVQEGVLYLVDSSQLNNNINLKGDWEFYWNQLLTPEDFKEETKPELTGYYPVLNTWNSYIVDGENLPGIGYATFRMNIEGLDESELYAFRFLDQATSFRVWVNGEEVAASGVVATNAEESVPHYLSHISVIEESSATMEVIMQIANFTHPKGGFREQILFGKVENIYNTRYQMIAFQTIVFLAMVMIGVFNIFRFLLRKQNSAELIFAVITLFFALRAVLVNERVLILLIPKLSWDLAYCLEILSTYITVPAFALLIYVLFKDYINELIMKVIIFIGLIFVAVTLLFSVKVYYGLLPVFYIYSAFSAGYSIYCIIKAVISKNKEAPVMLAGIFIFLITAINDVLYVEEIIHTYSILSLGILIFLIFQSLSLMVKSENAFKMVEELSENLEIGVERRTAQLLEKNVELENLLNNVKELSGLLPICANCKKIRDDNGYWHQVEEYIHEHSEADFTHGICPECQKKLYPELYKDETDNQSESDE